MRKKPTKISMVERAVIASQWSSITWDANIHALMGSSEPDIANKCGRVFFVAIALSRLNCPGSADQRIMLSTMNALYEIVDTDQIDDLTSQSIISGLRAASRVYHAATHRQIVDAACGLELKLRKGDVRISDFEMEAA